jgi:hypothetical protein
LISITQPAFGGDGVEAGNVGREASACGSFEPKQRQATSIGVAVVAGTFYRIPRERLFAAARQSDEVASLIAGCREWTCTQAQHIAVCNALHDVEERLARWLLVASQKLNTSTIVATQEQMARTLGVRRTTVTLAAQFLHARGSIDYTRGRITILDPRPLRAVACECCESLSMAHWPSPADWLDPVKDVEKHLVPG